MACVVIRKIAFNKDVDTVLEILPFPGPSHLQWFHQKGYRNKGGCFFAKGRKNVVYASHYFHWNENAPVPSVSKKEEYLRFLADNEDKKKGMKQ